MNMQVPQLSSKDSSRHYSMIERAIHWLRHKHLEQPSLSELAEYLSVSEFHLQRVFGEWAGITPKQFLQVLTKEYAKQILSKKPILETALDSGLSASSRLHDLFVTYEAMSPGEYKQKGKGLSIEFGCFPCPFGMALIAKTKRGICKLSFYDDTDQLHEILNELKTDWANATIIENQAAIDKLGEHVFGADRSDKPIHLLLKGSPFRVKVWEALLAIPEGQLSSYQDIAKQIGQPTASRAAASAIAKNDIAYLIPCHRVIRGSGEYHQYRWGPTRKAAMIASELS